MDLYVLRHAIAAARDARKFPDDADRPLTDKGIAKLGHVTQGMQELGLDFDLVLTSPYVRARQTAEIVVKALRLEVRARSTRELAPDGDPKVLIADVLSARAARPLLVGHEPYLSELISVLLSGDPHLGIALKKAGLCKLTAETLRFGRCASLEWLLSPAHFEKRQ